VAAPTATYRLQFNKDFRLADAEKLIDYLDALGISHVYASPLLKSRAGSMHGYDVEDPTVIDPEIGSEDEFAAFSEALRSGGLSILLDIVPNHMAADLGNPWWRDVLERGRDSEYARYFDIDWDRGGGKIVLPILGEPLEELLASGGLHVRRDNGSAWVEYEDTRLPVAAGAYDGGEDVRELLARQHYKLEYWRTGSQKLNYRRFFDVSELVSLREEDPEVFHRAHQRVMEMVLQGQVSGLRVDHVDGLRDPKSYLERLQLAARAQSREPAEEAYVVVEKITARDESLPDDWPCAGTTGYDFLNEMNGLFIDPNGIERLTSVYEDFVGAREKFADVAYDAKKQVMTELFAGEMRVLNRRLAELARADHALAAEDLSRALTEVMGALPVYRTYTRALDVRESDRRVIEDAVATARRRAGDVPGEAFNFLRRVLLLENPADERGWLAFVVRWQQFTGPITAKGVEDTAFYRYVRLISANEVGGDPGSCVTTSEWFHEQNAHWLERWPQKLNATSTHDTKRSEDVRARINVLSEMADDWRAAVERWRAANDRKKKAVAGRAAPDACEEYFLYQTLVGAWPLDESELPALCERLPAVIEKSLREAKRNTSWLNPDAEWEAGVQSFAAALFEDEAFLEDFRAFMTKVELPGAVNSLAQIVLKATAPGVPDVYQGSELWDFSLVDPDNRRPVDFERRERFLESFERVSPEELLANWRDGRVKLYVTQQVLRMRREHPALFAEGTYEPLATTGPRAERLVAFARVSEAAGAAVIAPRLVAPLCGSGWPLGDAWIDTAVRLPDGEWRDVFSGETTPGGVALAADLLRSFPVAVLARQA
jgi:(1->4)-alpha-D-glucan 1-alpha-D-glucosylmutase